MLRKLRETDLTHSDALNDLEYSRSADNKQEETNEPGCNCVLIFSSSRGFGYVSPHSHHFACLLIGEAHSLLGHHFDLVDY